MRRRLFIVLCSGCLAPLAWSQSAVQVPRPEEKDREERVVAKEQNKVAQAANLEINGARAFSDKELRSQLKEQITAIQEFGLSAARADDASFFLALFYRKHGYSKVNVRYSLPGGSRLRLDIDEGPLVTLANVNFIGNEHEPADKLFDYVVGPTRERYSKAQRNLPFVAADVEEGVDLVHRLYVAEGFLNAIVQAPHYHTSEDGTHVDATIAIIEGRQYSFGDIAFSGQAIYDAETLRGQMLDLIAQPYTDGRLADIPRRLQAYYKARGYFAAKVDAVGEPAAARAGRVPVRVTIAAGPVYHFDGATVTGLERLRPSYVTNRFRRLHGKPYSPDVIDEKFRDLMKTGLFNILQIKPVPTGANLLHLEISAEEAKSKEFGVSLGYGSYVGALIGASYRDRDLFGYGRPLTMSAEYTTRGYKGEVLYEDPYLFETENHLKVRISALTYDFDGYSKFEFGGRVELSRHFTKKYEIGAVFIARHVEVTSADIAPQFLGRKSYQVNSIGMTQTLDLRESPFVSPRGLVIENTLDIASSSLGSQIEFLRSTARASYYLQFAPRKQTAVVAGESEPGGFSHWFQQSSVAFGARVGIIHSVGSEQLPIDERFFNGGSTTVRSFAERDLGPHDRNRPIGGEFFTVFNTEYTFPIFGELQGALFVDAGNLLASSDEAGLSDLRYAVGVGLRYKLPIGPVRIDYGVNPSPRSYEDAAAFHFSFGFAF
ncbi:MAG: BamA/TamA family outer membrane protein [Verrucomicrobiota bacterium]|nr:BamA/TamA family outer membrane protein [Verrucomicrobiota bacterium]